MKHFSDLEFWFVTGSQDLYGEATLRQVAQDAQKIANGLDGAAPIPARVVFKPVLKNPEAIRRLCLEANSTDACAGLITWMHTFSPAKMWIGGLAALQKPFAHLHTQFNRDIPWSDIDMDFMNLNQSAHGGREFGFMVSRMRIDRKVIVGFWQDPSVQAALADWMRSAVGIRELRHLKVARFGDNMREVAVTEGDKVAAQLQFGYSVNGYGLGELAAALRNVSDSEVSRLVDRYHTEYVAKDATKTAEHQKAVAGAARIEIGMRKFLESGGFGAFTTTFENLEGLPQLPGIAVQRLMADGYGFGAEGDWKTAALVRAMKVMSRGLAGGTSFMEDYTYHFDPAGMKVLGAHMLEVCTSIADGKPSLEVHPLSIGGKADPARLVFNVAPGPAINASIIDMGNRFRMIVNEVDVVKPEKPLPKLPVARVVWIPRPNLPTAAGAWILAGGAHHTGFSQSLTLSHMQDFCDIAGIELLPIDSGTSIREFRNEIRWNEAYYTSVR